MRVTFNVDDSSESGADIFYDIITAPTPNLLSIKQAYLTHGLSPRSAAICHIYCYSQFDSPN